jgi:hypothetical protein
MKRSIPGPNIHHLAACVLYAPGLSLVAFFACVLLASIPQALTGGVDGGGVSIDAIFSGVVSLIALFILVTLWGLIPALLFGGVGCWLAERSLQTRAWWAWGLAGCASASAYVVVSLICRTSASAVGFLMAPWMFRAELEPGVEGIFSAWDAMLAASVAGILTGGFLAGALYFRLCRGRWAPIGADKRM